LQSKRKFMPSFNPQKFLGHYSIPYWTEGKNVSPGWVNINCPFCPDPSNHGGFNKEKGFYNCWICGWHPMVDVIMELVGCNYYAAVHLFKEFSVSDYDIEPEIEKPKPPEKLYLPTDCKPMQKMHHLYLQERKFDSEKLEKMFNLMGTGYIGDYKFRIIAPIYYNGIMVSYQGRDITRKAKLRYKACSKENEIIHHKHILYGIDYTSGSKGIIVEGITDVWRLGYGAVATFGTSYTQEQIHIIRKKFNAVFILYDEDSTERAVELGWKIDKFGKSGTRCQIIELQRGDIGDMPQDEADNLKREVLG